MWSNCHTGRCDPCDSCLCRMPHDAASTISYVYTVHCVWQQLRERLRLMQMEVQEWETAKREQINNDKQVCWCLTNLPHSKYCLAFTVEVINWLSLCTHLYMEQLTHGLLVLPVLSIWQLLLECFHTLHTAYSLDIINRTVLCCTVYWSHARS